VLETACTVLGLIVGSFLNVVIARVPEGRSIVRPGSHCPRCGHVLRWWENVPVVSWLGLGGRCRKCRAPISVRYLAVELLTGLLFLGCAWRFGPGWELVRGLLLVGFLVPLAVIDLEQWLLPFELTLPGGAAGLLSALPLGRTALVESVIGAAAGFLVFYWLERFFLPLLARALRALFRLLIRLARQPGEVAPEADGPIEALGAGDKWLMLLVGAFLGWRPLFGVFLLSNVQGAVVGLVFLAFRGRAGPGVPAAASAKVASAPGEQDGSSSSASADSVPAVPRPPPGAADAPQLASSEEDDWVPGRTHLPFGPWIALSALELLLFGPWLLSAFPTPIVALITGEALRGP
jgi:leader peptidase (prepilin peptidase) / N-methyltransferase